MGSDLSLAEASRKPCPDIWTSADARTSGRLSAENDLCSQRFFKLVSHNHFNIRFQRSRPKHRNQDFWQTTRNETKILTGATKQRFCRWIFIRVGAGFYVWAAWFPGFLCLGNSMFRAETLWLNLFLVASCRSDGSASFSAASISTVLPRPRACRSAGFFQNCSTWRSEK